MTRIDTEIFVMLAEAQDYERTHFEGCYHYHLPCAIKYLAGALDAAQKLIDELIVQREQFRTQRDQALDWVPEWAQEDMAEDEAWKNL